MDDDKPLTEKQIKANLPRFATEADDVTIAETRSGGTSQLRIVQPSELLVRLRSGRDLSEADALILLDWIQREVLDGTESPEEALVKVLTLPQGNIAQFRRYDPNQARDGEGRWTDGQGRTAPQIGEIIDQRGQRRSRLEMPPIQDPPPRNPAPWRRGRPLERRPHVIGPPGTPLRLPSLDAREAAGGWRTGTPVSKSTGEKIAGWFRNEFMPTGEFDVGDFLLAFFTLPARVAFPTGDPHERLLNAQRMRVFHLQGQHDQQTHAGGRASTEFEPITADEARGNSRPVTSDEFQRLAAIGQQQIEEMAADTQPIGLDENWTEIQQGAFDAAQESWGGATIDARTGEFLASDADRYALTVKDPGFETVSVPEGASKAEFEAAMTEARDKFRPILERRDHYLGVFHDDDLGRIDFDPVTVVDTLEQVETIGAATRAIGGAYNFADGNGYWPPHVDDERAVVASASMGSMEEKTSFKGPAEWKRQAKQLEGAPDAVKTETPKKRQFKDPGQST